MPENIFSIKNIRMRDGTIPEYRKHLGKLFSKSKHFEEFKHYIGNQLVDDGILEWSYSLLNLPSKFTAADQLGTISEEIVTRYMEESLYENDMVLQHFETTSNNKHLFQSDLEVYINQAPISSTTLKGHTKIIDLNKTYGHDEVCCIPISTPYNGSRYLFCLTSKGGYGNTFKNNITKNINKYITFAHAISDVGSNLFPEIFVEPVTNFKTIISSQPLSVLALMADHDLNVKECAKNTGLSQSTINNHLTKIRKQFGASTNHGALRYAQNNGFIKKEK